MISHASADVGASGCIQLLQASQPGPRASAGTSVEVTEIMLTARIEAERSPATRENAKPGITVDRWISVPNAWLQQLKVYLLISNLVSHFVHFLHHGAGLRLGDAAPWFESRRLMGLPTTAATCPGKPARGDCDRVTVSGTSGCNNRSARNAGPITLSSRSP